MCQARVSPDAVTYARPPWQCRRLPVEIITEGDIQMDLLLQKQLRTDVSLQDQLGSQMRFVSGALIDPEGSGVAARGSVSLVEYNTLMKANERADELRQFGLTEDEIELKLDSEKKIEQNDESNVDEPNVAKKLRPLADNSVRVKRLGDIDEKIADRQRRLAEPIVFSGARVLTRHERDLERAITHDPDRSKLTDCLLIHHAPVEEVCRGDMRDPINHLEEIWNEVVERGFRGPSQVVHEGKRSRRRKRQAEKKRAMESIDSADEECVNGDISLFIGCLTREETFKRDASLMDASLMENRLEEIEGVQESDDTCCSTSEHQVRTVEEIPIEVIERHRLDVAKIRELARFKDYSPGIPSQTLYLKNMSPRVTREDLVSMFGRFETPNDPPIIYKLFAGRMRGQAFVTFHSTDTATSALQLINGYDFKGRNIIIQYGRNTRTEKLNNL